MIRQLTKIEDLTGRLLILAVMYPPLLFKTASLYNSGTHVSVESAITVLSLVFAALMVLFTAIRLPPINTARGIEPRASAILGTFLIVGLNFLPNGEAPQWIKYVGLGLTATGFSSSIFCIIFLGRSFSIMAAARKLVTTGPYSIVRHPLYFCENLFVAGAVISHFSTAGVLLWGAQIALQVRRMINEERVLRETFSEYEEYGQRVPMIIPRLGFAGVPKVQTN